MTHRILIVDDDLHIREVIRVALRKAGMTVFEARDGKEALTRFAGDRPDLIILDIGMPEFDGLDVCREIRKSYRWIRAGSIGRSRRISISTDARLRCTPDTPLGWRRDRADSRMRHRYAEHRCT